MLGIELKELSEITSNQKINNNLSELEMRNVNGGGITKFLWNTFVSGATYDATKAAASWAKDNAFVDPEFDNSVPLEPVGISPVYQGIDVTGATSNIA